MPMKKNSGNRSASTCQPPLITHSVHPKRVKSSACTTTASQALMAVLRLWKM